MKESGLRCALLDLGNVLVKFDLSRFGERMQSLTGLGLEQLRTAFAADDLAYKYESGQMGDQEFLAEVRRRLQCDIRPDQFAAAWNSIFLDEPLLRDELLAGLAARLDLWIISNTNPIHFEYVRKQYDFFRHFRGWILSYESGALKPDPAIFARAVEKTGVEAGRTLFVDDLTLNVEAARSFGFQAFQFLDETDFVAQLRSLGLVE